MKYVKLIESSEFRINPNGVKSWHDTSGKLHREGGPAIERTDGSTSWYQNGKLHREDGPALEFEDGSKYWFQNDRLHREDGPAKEFKDGSNFWYFNGEDHRVGGPAQEWPNGLRKWYQNGQLHREDGPAVEEEANGFFSYYLNNIKYPSFNSWLKNLIKIKGFGQVFNKWKGSKTSLKTFLKVGLFSEKEILNIIRKGEIE